LAVIALGGYSCKVSVPATSNLDVGRDTPTPTFPVVVSTNKLAVPTSTFPLTVASPLTVKLLESSAFPLTVKLLVTSKFSPTETFETDVSIVVCMSAPGKFMMCVDII
jgi:hypothetical protein